MAAAEVLTVEVEIEAEVPEAVVDLVEASDPAVEEVVPDERPLPSFGSVEENLAEMKAAGEMEAEPTVEPDQEENHRHLKPALMNEVKEE